MKKTCFAIMPFEGFEEIDRIICETAQKCGLKYHRGDRHTAPGSVLPQIVRDIHKADVVVAVITGHNPNVFYELGIAHQLKGPERVVIMRQKLEKEPSPYDVNEFRQLVYTLSETGRAALRTELLAYLKEAKKASNDREVWSVIRGRLQRTRLIVRDLERLANRGRRGGLDHITICIVASLGSLAISDHEPPGTDLEYHKSLLDERNALRDVLVLGAKLKGLLMPPRSFAHSKLPERLSVRYDRLIDLLEGRSDIRNDAKAAAADLAAIKKCEFALTPVSMPNLFIIGDSVAYEGMKRGGTAGFEMTHCETNAAALREMIQQFERGFEESRREMLRAHPPDGRLAEQLRGFHRQALAARPKKKRGEADNTMV